MLIWSARLSAGGSRARQHNGSTTAARQHNGRSTTAAAQRQHNGSTAAQRPLWAHPSGCRTARTDHGRGTVQAAAFHPGVGWTVSQPPDNRLTSPGFQARLATRKAALEARADSLETGALGLAKAR